MSKIVSLNNGNFINVVDHAKTMVLVYFWNSESKQQKSVLEATYDYTNQLLIAEANVEDNTEILRQLNLKNIPAFVLFHMGMPVATWTKTFYTPSDVVKAVFGE